MAFKSIFKKGISLSQAGQSSKHSRKASSYAKQAMNCFRQAKSMKGDKKPVAFIEDCAVSLEHLADYTARLKEIFKKYGTSGMFYAHASVGTLHVRPVLNMKSDKDIQNMRSISEEAFEMVKDYKGSHSGEHGDGIVRSEFHEILI